MSDTILTYELDKDLIQALKMSGSNNKAEALMAQDGFAKGLETPLRKGIMYGNIINNIFKSMPLESGASPEFPLDLLAPGTERDYTAYTNPGHGRIPEKSIESDYVMLHLYSVANSIDFLIRYARAARWDIVSRALQIMTDGVIKKLNDDGWHTILTAVADRDILVYDGDAAQGQLTKRLFSLLRSVMVRNGGGNSVTATGRITDVFLSPEAKEDIRNWGIDQLDDISRREVYMSANGISEIFKIRLNELFEFGDDQEYQKFYLSDIGASLAASDVELVVGLDLNSNDSFVMPTQGQLEIFADETLHRHQRQGYYCILPGVGFGVLDNRRVIGGSF